MKNLKNGLRTATPVTIVSPHRWPDWEAGQDARLRRWAGLHDFSAKRGHSLVIPSPEGGVERVVVGVEEDANALWDLAGLPGKLPDGVYALDPAEGVSPDLARAVCLGWALGGYRYDTYKADDAALPVLAWPDGVDQAEVTALYQGISLARDLITTPANDMGPAEITGAAQKIADQFKAQMRVLTGEELLQANYPAIYQVGAGSARQPRLIDLTWGDQAAKKVTLVGKGVVFDTGGYDLKPSSAMRLMKKDMGGAAITLGLASVLMAMNLPIRLRLLIPAVENSVSGTAMRPGDVIRTRAGKTVEVGNTDAEGRLILADALTEAAAEEPDLLVDVATLTGAARVALGLGVPALFSNDDALAGKLQQMSRHIGDPLWQLPLWRDYGEQIKSRIADLSNNPSEPFGGAITAALFLEHFIGDVRSWVHIDVMAYNRSSAPGRPEGGEAQGLRALYAHIKDCYGS